MKRISQKRTFISTRKEYPVIYFLYYKNEIVYIGQSIYHKERITFHQKNKKFKFDSYSVRECSKEQLNELESEMILKHLPKNNKVLSAVKTLPTIYKVGYISKNSTNKKNRYTIPILVIGKYLYIDLKGTGIKVHKKLDGRDEK